MLENYREVRKERIWREERKRNRKWSRERARDVKRQKTCYVEKDKERKKKS